MKIVAVEPLGISLMAFNSIKSEFENAGHEFIMFSNRVEDSKVITERAKDADIMVVSNIPVTRELLESLPKLKLLNIAFTGVDHVDIQACEELQITVCNAAGYSTTGVSELTIGLILDVYRKITTNDAKVRQQKTREGFLGREISGKTAAIIGTGAIGMRTASILNAMGAEVIAYSRSRKEEAKEKGIRYLGLDELLRKSDIISLHVPYTEDTRHMISEDRLMAMKSSAILINTARGQIVDYKALASALKEGKIAGAGIDVYEHEPPIPADHPLMDAPNLVMLPHIGYATAEAMENRAAIVKENVFKWLEGKPQNLIHLAGA